MAGIGSLFIDVTANAGGFIRDMQRARRSAAQFNRTARQVDQVNAAFRKLGLTIASVTGGVGILAFSRSVVDAGNKLEGFRNTLTAATGDVRASAREFAFLKDTANRLGVDFQAAAQGYAKLAAASKGTALEGQKTRDIFVGIAEAATVMRFSAADLNLVLFATQQIISKGTVSAEELKRQFGERVPGAMNQAAISINKTVAELNKMLEEGKLLAEDFLPKFIAQISKAFGPGLSAAVTSAQADINRLNNEFLFLKSEIAESGFLRGIADGARAIAEAFRDPATIRAVREFGEGVGKMLKVIADNLPAVITMVKTLGLIIGLTAAGRVLRVVVGMFRQMGIVVSVLNKHLGGLTRTFAALFGAGGLLGFAVNKMAELVSGHDDAAMAAQRQAGAVDALAGSLKDANAQANALTRSQLEQQKSLLAGQIADVRGRITANEQFRDILRPELPESVRNPLIGSVDFAAQSALTGSRRGKGIAGILSGLNPFGRKKSGPLEDFVALGQESDKLRAKLAGLETQLKDLQDLTKAPESGTSAPKILIDEAAVTKAQGLIEQIHQTFVENTHDEIELIQRRADLNEQAIRKNIVDEEKRTQAIRELNFNTEREITSIIEERAERAIEAEQKIAEEKKRLSDDAARKERETAEQMARNRARAAEREKQILIQPFLDAGTRIQALFADTFEKIFAGGVNSFSDLAQAGASIMRRMFAEIAALAIIRPIIQPIVSGVGGAISSAGASLGGSIFGSSVGASIASKGIVGGLFSSATGAINSFGASLGFDTIAGAGVLPPGVAGPTLPGGTLFPGATLSGTLGAAGLGAFGGSLIAQLTGGSSTGGAIGGALGAGAGFAFGGPVGGIIGGLLGGAGGGFIGGLFGKKRKPNKGPLAQQDLSVVGGLAALGATSIADRGDLATVTALAAQAQAQINSVLESFNLSLSSGGRVGKLTLFSDPEKGSGQQAGFFIDKFNQRPIGSPEAAVNRLVLQVLQGGRVTGASPEIAAALRNTGATTAQGLAADLTFAKAIGELNAPQLSATAQALKEINDNFAEMTDRANALGISTTKIEAARVKAIDDVRKSIEDGARLALLAIEDPQKFALEQLQTQFKTLIKEAEDAGADTTLLLRRQALERQRIIDQFDQSAAREAAVFGLTQPAFADARSAALQRAGEFGAAGQNAAAFLSQLAFSEANPAGGAAQLQHELRGLQALRAFSARGGQITPELANQITARAGGILDLAGRVNPANVGNVFNEVRNTLGLVAASQFQQEREAQERAAELLRLEQSSEASLRMIANGTEVTARKLDELKAVLDKLPISLEDLRDAIALVVADRAA